MAGMHTGLSLNMHLAAKLTPQQVQLLKMLQMNGLQLEQYVRQELEQNPMLEEGSGENEYDDEYELTSVETLAEDTPLQEEHDSEYNADQFADAPSETPEIFNPENGAHEEEQTWVDFIEDEGNPPKYSGADDDDSEGFPTPETRSLLDELEDQLRLMNLSEEEQIIAEEILGSIEPSGYLYREAQEIVEAANEKIAALNDARRSEFEKSLSTNGDASNYQHDYRYDYLSAYANDNEDDFESLDLSPIAARRRQNGAALPPETLKAVELAQVERTLLIIQRLDPPGIGARDLRECLLAQLNALPRRNAAQQLAKLVLERCYDAFCKKHYETIMRDLKVSEDYLREALQAIQALNPKPGGMESAGTSSVIPDFLIHYDEKKDDFGIQLNDVRMPTVYVTKTYEKMKSQVREATQSGIKSQKMNEGTRQFLRRKYDDAKFLIAALKQRRQTMIKVMTAIVSHQRDFFLHGNKYIRPLIYKDIAEDTGVDISTVCRVVNNKYAQTDFGVLELRYFFSEGMPMSSSGDDEQEDVSTRVIKDKLREIIANENKKKPFSDDKLVKELQKSGYDIARRTVAKYREKMQIPVARMRKGL
jgi:RNA polymerase sigma-54 factor